MTVFKKAFRAIVSAFILTMLAATWVCAFGAGDTRLTYEERTGDKVILKNYTLESSADGYQLTIDQPDSVILSRSDKSLQTYFEHYKSKLNDDEVLVRLENGSLLFSGTIENKECSSEKESDQLPWFGSKLFLRDFVLSQDEKIEFLMTRPEDLKAIGLKAVKEGQEVVEIEGQKVEAIRVKFSLDDLRALFWSSTFWFRAADGILVKTEEVRGGPGTPPPHTVRVEAHKLPTEGDAASVGLSENVLHPHYSGM